MAADIPPVSSARPTAAAQTAATSTVRPVVTEVTVEKAPAEIYPGTQKVHLEGKVTASSPDSGEVRIATASGEVVVKSATPIPVDADVALDLYMQKGQLVANITLIRPQAAATAETPELPPAATPLPSAPLPPIKVGETVTAILIPKDAPPAALPPLPASQLTEIFAQLKASGFEKLPVPPESLPTLLSAADPLKDFAKLPLDDQQKIMAYLSKPEVLSGIKNIATPATEPLDNNLLQIVRAQLSARVTQDAIQGTPVPTSSVNATLAEPGAHPAMVALRGLLPLLEGVPAQAPATGFFVQKAAETMASNLPQNLHEIKIGGIFPPGTPATALPAGQTKGIIESITPRGFPVIQTDSGFFIVRASTAAPVGSTVFFNTKPVLPEEIMTPPGTVGTGLKSSPLTETAWPALQETLAAAAAASPDIASALRNSIPSPTPQLTPQVLFFLAALRTGLVENWLGTPTIDLLRQSGKKDLVERLTGDFAKLSTQSKSDIPGEWRAISMPMRNDEQLSQMQFFIRQQHDQDGKGEKDDSTVKPMTRFILNVHLSRLGDMQLDGLMHKKRLDIILRTAEQLPFPARQEIMQKFASGLDQTGMQGGISFQTRAQGWITLSAAGHEEITA